MPLSVGPHRGHLGSFQWLGFPRAGDPGVVYLENQRGGIYLEEVDEVAMFNGVFESLTEQALSRRTPPDSCPNSRRSWHDALRPCAERGRAGRCALAAEQPQRPQRWACVEAASLSRGEVTAVRDSKRPQGPALLFDRRSWTAFLRSLD